MDRRLGATASATGWAALPTPASLQPVPWYGVKGAKMETQLSIGAVARAANVGVETIRYYQRRKLVKEPTKPPGGQRRYPEAVVTRVRFIKRAQQLGFALEEIRELLQLDDGQSCRQTRLLAERKLHLIDERIVNLVRIRHMLEDLIGQCSKERGVCPIITALADTPTPALPSGARNRRPPV